MRKFTGLVGAVAMFTILPSTPALAEGAVIDKEAGICEGKVPNAQGVRSGDVILGSLLVRTNKSWTTMTCHFDLPEDQAPAKATHASGFNCTIDEVTTTDTRASASSGGRMVLTCRFKN